MLIRAHANRCEAREAPTRQRVLPHDETLSPRAPRAFRIDLRARSFLAPSPARPVAAESESSFAAREYEALRESSRGSRRTIVRAPLPSDVRRVQSLRRRCGRRFDRQFEAAASGLGRRRAATSSQYIPKLGACLNVDIQTIVGL